MGCFAGCLPRPAMADVAGASSRGATGSARPVTCAHGKAGVAAIGSRDNDDSFTDKCNPHVAVVVKTNGAFWGRWITHFSLFLWGLGCSLGYGLLTHGHVSRVGRSNSVPQLRRKGTVPSFLGGVANFESRTPIMKHVCKEFASRMRS